MVLDKRTLYKLYTVMNLNMEIGIAAKYLILIK